MVLLSNHSLLEYLLPSQGKTWETRGNETAKPRGNLTASTKLGTSEGCHHLNRFERKSGRCEATIRWKARDSQTSHRKFGGVILTDRVEDGSPEVPKLVLKYGMMIV
ncbi:hypothetical protein CPT_Spivey_115 [Klebsiella phage Spivey]|uniref:Uncharacterized protein n=2 Tax=Sugarlandvirus sugarland TaxID=2560546 RepID=A0A2H4PGZ9_9CAUD|nr:hypothetical protein FDJ18_gp140 [Klebsiella phage Sugarland]ATW61932.1 hypothetical protein CPT_Sugarland_119 [Klebsiella phage Sugarland]QBX06949.1 hypothetical protein CPT_Spivey_091 [Klebsiella phage Spivey]